MAPFGTRRHRLPQHRPDYILIPAPGDVSLSEMSEKSPLPAIIVTPSSPSCSADFSIAFLAPPEKPTICERLFSPAASLNLKARTIFMLLLLLFIMACHLFTHRLATSHPHLQFGTIQDIPDQAQSDAHQNHHMSWFNWQSFWGVQTFDLDGKREFVVAEPLEI
ncbi:hypothetical protein B0F90DRAFT_256610 [Multifurca ochricompacta]|uniref:Uncharacterized protein n=1 Tax=Multifurca ochricompacta TaxID=376703 RepID=A0AAD4M6A7_9AGAM|nr:hypothetical protein B0F90DRAFT_256610 [Multifurca ochricompacta]